MIEIPLSLEEFRRETIEEILDQTPQPQLLERLSVEERLKGLSLDDLVKALTPEVGAALAQRLKEKETPGNPSESTEARLGSPRVCRPSAARSPFFSGRISS